MIPKRAFRALAHRNFRLFCLGQGVSLIGTWAQQVAAAWLVYELTGSPRDNLGQAIHDVKPTADAKAAAKTAEGEARTDIKSTRPPDADNDAD